MFHCLHCNFSARSTVFVNKALYFDFSPQNMTLGRYSKLPLNTVTPNFVAIFVFFGTALSFIERISSLETEEKREAILLLFQPISALEKYYSTCVVYTNYRLPHSASELLGFTCTSSLTMSEKFQLILLHSSKI